MKLQSLNRIKKSLKTALAEIGNAGLRDRGIRHRYAEFLVAEMLARHGHKVQVLSEREDTNADIYLPDTRKKVEVKSCKAHDGNDDTDWAYASFGKGSQINEGKFDYCVFVVFRNASERVREILVFTRDELKEVAKIRKGLAAHAETNPCLLICAPTVQDYDRILKSWGVKPLKIERSLCRDRRRYMDQWGKVK